MDRKIGSTNLPQLSLSLKWYLISIILFNQEMIQNWLPLKITEIVAHKFIDFTVGLRFSKSILLFLSC